MKRKKLTQEEIFNCYREYYRKEHFNPERERNYSKNGGFEAYFQSILNNQNSLRWPPMKEMSLYEFTQQITHNDDFYLKWVENLSEQEIKIRKFPTDVIVNEFNRRVSEGIIKIKN